MRFQTAPAILLDVFDLHDRDRIVAFLTAEQGQVRGVASGARRKHSRFAGQLQPLAKVTMTWIRKEGRDLVRISDVELVRPATRLQSTLEGILLGGCLADHMLHFAQENEAGSPLFRLLDSTLESLETGVDAALAARYYETWMLRLAGIFPPPRECPLCGAAFEEGEGAALGNASDALICRRCAAAEPSIPVSPEALTFLRRTARVALPALAAEPPAPAVLAEVEKLVGRIRRSFLGHELKSYEVMHRTLAATF